MATPDRCERQVFWSLGCYCKWTSVDCERPRTRGEALDEETIPVREALHMCDALEHWDLFLAEDWLQILSIRAEPHWICNMLGIDVA